MKICPKCGSQYEYEMSFCLQDGTQLIFSETDSSLNNSEKTLVIPKPDSESEKTLTMSEPDSILTKQQTPQKTEEEYKPNQTIQTEPMAFVASTNQPKSYLGFVLGIILGLVIFSAAAIGGYIYWQNSLNKEVAAISNNNSSNTNTSEPSGNTNSNLGLVSNANANLKLTPNTSPTVSNSNKPTPTPTKEKERTPTPAPTVTPTATPTPPKITPTPTPVETPSKRPKVIAGGVINGKATNLVKPAYPPVARATRASGQVVVQVLVSETGSVISANAVSGHALLRNAAESAALASSFNPTYLGGQPVRVKGLVIYNFVP